MTAAPTLPSAPFGFAAEPILDEILDWISVESPTYAPEAVGAMQRKAAERIARLGFAVERLSGDGGGAGMVVGRRSGAAGRPGLLLIGHLDTVHPVGTLGSALPIRRDGDRCFGPGIYDMKAGLVMAFTALERLIGLGRLDSPVTILLNADEEIGSPGSRATIEREARRHAAVLIPEPAFGPDGEVTTGRHAFHRFLLKAQGRPAHSGWTNREGRSAISVLAQIVEEIEGRSDFDRGPTYAVGTFHGGQWVNCVPTSAEAQMLCVAREPAQSGEIERTVAALAGERSGVRVTVDAGPVRPLWLTQEGTLGLCERARAIAADLGFTLLHGQHGGGSDGNFTGALGIPTLDGLGAAGHGAHTHEEHILVSSLVPRTALLARLIDEIAAAASPILPEL